MPADGTYTYSSNPATDNKDAVRALIGDTNFDGKGWLVSDEEILWALATFGGPLQAGAQCCEMIQTHYTGPKRDLVQLRIGDLERMSGGRSGSGTTWLTIADRLRRQAGRGGVPAAGGIDISDRQSRSDPSQLQPAFYRGMDNFTPNDTVDNAGVDNINDGPLP